MFRRLSAFALALLLAGCAATPAPESAAATATPSPSAALTQTPGRCPTYEEAMAAAAGPGETGEGAYTDADACLQNAYALAAALYAKDASAAAAACGRALDDAPNENAGAADLFPFADLTGLVVEGFAFTGGGAGEPLWLQITVADPGATPLPAGATTYAVEFGDGYYTDANCVQALIPQAQYQPQQGRAWQAVTSFRNWVTGDAWQDAADLPPAGVAYYLTSFAAGRGVTAGETGAWPADRLAEQAQDAFGRRLDVFDNPSEAAFRSERYGGVYDAETDTFALAASPGDSNRNWRMTALTEEPDGTCTLTLAEGTNCLWMEPAAQLAYTLQENDDGSFALLGAQWAGGEKTPRYEIWNADVRLPDGTALPETLPLRVEFAPGATWQQAAEAVGMQPADLQALNPGVPLRDDGTFDGYPLLVDTGYPLPQGGQRKVRIVTPWVAYQGEQVYTVPASLSREAGIAAAEAADFLRHLSLRSGYWPAEPVESETGAELYQAQAGARFTEYGDLENYLAAVFTPELAAQYAAGGYEPAVSAYVGYLAGPQGELRFGGGERGGNPLLLTELCTEPQTRPDGSLVYGILGIESAADAGPGGPPACAVWHTVRLVETEEGWRVAEMTLAG